MREINMTERRKVKKSVRRPEPKAKVYTENILARYFKNIATSDSEEHAAYNIGAIQSIVKVLHFQGGDIKINVELVKGYKHED
jgi:ATP-dependent Lon protease